MYKFKINDIVIASSYYVGGDLCMSGEEYFIIDQNNSKNPYVKTINDGVSGVINQDSARLAPVDNKLNRKLYPNYKEYKGYLIPKEYVK